MRMALRVSLVRGNMDYNQLREGTTVYLPVYHPGALLFVGDGHDAQGDGELTGDALETSMDILERDCKLTGSDAAMVMGFALKYDVVDLVGTQVSVAAKVPKAALAPLKGN